MPSLNIMNTKEINSDWKPIALIKGDERNKHFNKFLCVNEKDDIKGAKNVNLPDDLMFQPLPDTNQNKRDVYYIAGASGSGKSYSAKTIANNYLKLYPDRQIYVVSKLDEDETLDSIIKPVIRLNYKEFEEDPPDLDDFYDCLIIFDDFDTIQPKKLMDKVLNFIDDIATMGRKHKDGQGNVSMIVISHYLTNYKKTRLILNECSHMVLFPQATSSHALNYVLKNYIGMDKNDVQKLKKLGRWVMIHKMFPQFVLSSQKAYLLNQE
jgi:hypothetical protein